MGVAFHVHVAHHPHRARGRDPADIVAPEIHQHDVLGALLGIGGQLVGEAAVEGAELVLHAAAIADLVLWIGFLLVHGRRRGG